MGKEDEESSRDKLPETISVEEAGPEKNRAESIWGKRED